MATATPCEMVGTEILNKMYKSKVTPEEALEYLTSTCENVDAFINHSSFTQETAGMLIHCIATASNCESLSSRQQMLQLFQFTSVSSLLTSAGAKLLLGIGTDIRHPFSCILSDILTIFKTWLLVMPHDLGSPQVIGLLELMYKQIQRSINLENQETLLQDVSQLQNDLLKIFADRSKDKNREKRMGAPEDKLRPPEDFRILSVMPEENDLLYQTYFLRKNKAIGKYINLDHYLDVQFRLYREDCIIPLREAFEEFQFKSKENRTFRMENARIYRDVQICRGTQISLEHGEVFEIELDNEHCRRIHWNNSKRLLFGSLLLLSFDNFKTTYFAVVADSDREMIRANGRFPVKLFRTRSNQIIPRETKGTILEATSAYYEAYHHVLSALKLIHEDTFPFEKYIVECNNAIGYPRYLDMEKEITYDLQPIITGGRIVLDHNKSSEVLEGLRIPVLNTKNWPTKEDLKMDESQRQAFISAITKEFAIIQGPPGTGKTYIGLQIAKCLLHNFYKLNTHHVPVKGGKGQEAVKTPCMLVVCFTNHALDQFVEGIIDFLPIEVDDTESKHDHIPKVVRIGSRCKNSKVDKYSLKNIRWKMGKKATSMEILRKAEDCKRNIMMVRSSLKATQSQNIVLKFSQVKGYISEEHQLNYGENPEEAWEDWIHISLRSWFEEVQKKRVSKRRNKRKKYKDKIIIEDNKSVIVNIITEAEYAYSERSLDEDTNFVFDSSIIGIDLRNQLNDVLENVNDMITQQMYREEMELVLIELKSDLVASEDMMENVKDLWALSISDRFKIYRYWLKKYVDDMKEILVQKENEFHNIFADYQKARAEIDEEILSQTSVIALTTTGAAKYHESLNKIGPQITIIEEAAEVPEAHVVTAINPKCQHVILIGDHKQLEPKPAVQELAIKYNLSLSLFERMINNGLHYNCLQRQHRMRPEISELVRHMYPALDDNENVKEYENVKGVRKNLFFITHEQEEQYNNDLKSFYNEHEAEYVKELCSYLIKQGYKGSEITIIAAYTSQMMLIRSKLPRPDFEGVTICVLDNYQGEENEIVLLSLVRSNSQGEIGFLKKPNRICVGLSRAKKGLYIIGNSATLTKGSDEWNIILTKIKSSFQTTGEEMNCSFGKALPLYCQNHPKKDGILAENPKDFSKAPDGGCLLPCQMRLNCGHVCRQYCHPYDPDHELYRCNQACYKRCEDGHICSRRCHYLENCNCNVVVYRLLTCSHTVSLECYVDFSKYDCQEMVEKTFVDCGHSITVPCYKKLSDIKCMVEIEKILQCRHTKMIKCCKRDLNIVCLQQCGKQCDNNHVCNRVCHFPSECNCRIQVTKKIPKCGHEALLPCSEDIISFKDCSTEVDIVLDICGHTVSVPCYKKYEMEKLSASDRKVMEKRIKCLKQVEVGLPRCGHIEKIPCWQSVELHNENKCQVYKGLYSIEDRLDIKCSTIVEFELACGHRMQSECWKKYLYWSNSSIAELQCKCIVDLKLDCGHTKEVECYASSKYQKVFTSSSLLRYQNSYIKCCINVDLQLECEHILEVQCWQKSQYEKGFRNNLEFKCKSQVEIPLKLCGHMLKVECYKRTNTECKEDVIYTDPKCGHERQIKCFEHPKHRSSAQIDNRFLMHNPVLSPCKFLVQKNFACGHQRSVECHESKKAVCLDFCHEKLLCNHPCMELCQKCRQGFIHKECDQICKRQLFCGHNCESQQCMKCKPCKQQCQFACEHSACGLECMKQCKPCIKPCAWVCKHFKCSRLCWEICDRPLCSQDCESVLKCGHRCPGFCSEPCPRSCMACDRSKYHVSSNNENVKFVTIQTCGHSFDFQYLDNYMTESAKNLLSRCPVCKTVLLKHPRYNELLKMKRKYMDTMKEQTLISMTSSDCFPKCDQRILQQFENYIVRFRKYLNVMLGIERNQDSLLELSTLKNRCEKLLQFTKFITPDKCQIWVDIAWSVFRLHAVWILRLCSKSDELLEKNIKLESNVIDPNDSVLKTRSLKGFRNEISREAENNTPYSPEDHRKVDVLCQNYNTLINSFPTDVKSYHSNEEHQCTENDQYLDVDSAKDKITRNINDDNKCQNSQQTKSVQDDTQTTLQSDQDEITDTLTGQEIISKIRKLLIGHKQNEIKMLLPILTPFIKDDMYYNEAMNYPKLTLIGVHDDDWALCQNGHIVPIVVGHACLICSGEGEIDFRHFNVNNSSVPFDGTRRKYRGINDAQTTSTHTNRSLSKESITLKDYIHPRGGNHRGRRRPNRAFIQQTRSNTGHQDTHRQDKAASWCGNGSLGFPILNQADVTRNTPNILHSNFGRPNDNFIPSNAWNQSPGQGGKRGVWRAFSQPTVPSNAVWGQHFFQAQPYTFQEEYIPQVNPYEQNNSKSHQQKQRGRRRGRKK